MLLRVVLMVGLTTLAGCGHDVPYQGDGFTVRIPAGWTWEDIPPPPDFKGAERLKALVHPQGKGRMMIARTTGSYSRGGAIAHVHEQVGIYQSQLGARDCRESDAQVDGAS